MRLRLEATAGGQVAEPTLSLPTLHAWPPRTEATDDSLCFGTSAFRDPSKQKADAQVVGQQRDDLDGKKVSDQYSLADVKNGLWLLCATRLAEADNRSR